ncbi:uncharacterized protein LOC132281905 [Cornus florida]|uniref:uncharacterized protein LOC132281905 n=1 Tax=Cornus florida TaxID=4283 RepID=UPI0028989624|nr:uncharacterized protein LOC132281905 [Cornus florida]
MTLIFFQKTVSLQIRAAKAAAAVPPECRTGTDGWIQFDERELQHRRSLVERNATWQMMHLSSCSPPTYLINTNTISSTATTTTTAIPVTTMDPNIINTTQDLNIFTSPAYRDEVLNHILNGNHSDHSGQVNLSCGESHETLQLFPLRSGNGDENGSEKEAGISGADMNANYTPYQFFEFLPLKN